MLKKANRILVQEYRSQRGQAKRGTLFSVKMFASMAPQLRVGVIVSRAVSPKATVRNRIKRSVYDFFASRIASAKPQDLLVIAQKGAATASKDDIIKELKELTN